MSLNSEITRLQNAKASIKTAIENKGVTVPASTKLDGYSALVDSISGEIEEVSTYNDMIAKMTAANVGEVYKFTGTTDDTFTNGEIYKLKEITGGYQFSLCPKKNGTLLIASNGTYDVTNYKSAFVDNVEHVPRFVCVGESGKSYYSTDGTSWESTMVGLDLYTYTGVTYGNGRFVCISDQGGISYYSTDGLTWNAMSGLDSYIYNAVTYGNGRFVCVGQSGKSYYSTDGLTWTSMSGLDSYEYNGVTYGDGKFVCVGSSGRSYYSTNGTSWTAMSGLSTSSIYYGVTYGNGRFVCVGNKGASYYSTNGTSWTAMSGLSTNAYRGVTYGNGRFVCVGISGRSYYSTNGTSWTAMSGLDTSYNYNGVTYTGWRDY